jgi:potassium/hydrogen antiporter
VLVGGALAPTDPAAVYAVLRGRSGSGRARTILEGESGFNDPTAIALMVAVTAAVASEHSSYAHAVFQFVEELAIGSAAGIAGGFLLGTALRVTRLEGSVQAVAMLLGVVLLGATTVTLHGSGFLAVYVCGLLLSDQWSRMDRSGRAVPEALSVVAEVLLFVLLGAALAPLIGVGDIVRGMVITLATVFAVRPLVASLCLVGSGLHGDDRALVSWGGLKGAVPLLLGAYPMLEHFRGGSMVAATVLVATAASLVIQGATLPLIAGRAVAREKRERSKPTGTAAPL